MGLTRSKYCKKLHLTWICYEKNQTTQGIFAVCQEVFNFEDSCMAAQWVVYWFLIRCNGFIIPANLFEDVIFTLWVRSYQVLPTWLFCNKKQEGACLELVGQYGGYWKALVLQHWQWGTLEMYSQLSLRRTPLGPAVSVCLRDVSVI